MKFNQNTFNNKNIVSIDEANSFKGSKQEMLQTQNLMSIFFTKFDYYANQKRQFAMNAIENKIQAE